MRGVRAGLGVLVGLALVGCTGAASEPDVGASSPRVSAEASVSASPSVPTKPTRPEAMDRDDAEGAAAAAVYFIELYPYVMATGDTAEFEAMSHRACGFCDDAVDQAKTIEKRDQTWTGGSIRVQVVRSFELDTVTGVFPLDVEVRQEAAQIRGADGDVVFEGADERAIYRAELGRKDGKWVVVEIAPEPTA